MDVSVIIVNYNTKELLRDCLNSIYNNTENINYEIIVSDNASQDGSIEMIQQEFPDVILIQNSCNLGFGKANNVGLSKATGKYIFYLNSDTILLNNAIKYFYDYWESSSEKKRIGALGANLENLEGDIVSSYGNFPTVYSEIKSLIGCSLSMFGLRFHSDKNKAIYKRHLGNVDFIIGADLFLLNNENAVFDERYFMYYEETDLQLKMLSGNLERILIEGPRIIHFAGGSEKMKTSRYSFNKTTSGFYWKSCILYLEKNSSHYFLVKILKYFLLFMLKLPQNKKNNLQNIQELMKNEKYI